MFQTHPPAIVIAEAFLAEIRKMGETPVITVYHRD